MRIRASFAISMAALMLAVWTLQARRNPGASSTPLSPAIELASDRSTSEQAIRFLEKRIQADHEDFIAHNKLAGYYLQRVRETGDLTYLNLASRASRASLASMPAEKNSSGLAALSQAEFSSHEFAASRDHAKQLAQLEPDKSYPQQLLGDALLELGDYQAAKGAFFQMERLGGINALTRVATEQRIARMALLQGDPHSALKHMRNATALALAMPNPPRETVAWCRWQLGEIAFSMGDYAAAEQHEQDALTTFPDYFKALASLGRIRAARGNLSDAIGLYQRAVQWFPDPAFVATLGDLYKLAGREQDAAAQYALVEAITRLNQAAGNLYNRQQALYFADHDLNPQLAYANAVTEYNVRKDIYGADAVAWTALKAGKLREANASMQEALRLGTQDSKLFYHAGMIARAIGDFASARYNLKRALMLNPKFDPLQAPIAESALSSLAQEEQQSLRAKSQAN
jgi:tetratricopeptide (TPR) repeat protein